MKEVVVTEYYEDGKLMRETPIENGEIHGIAITYYPNEK